MDKLSDAVCITFLASLLDSQGLNYWEHNILRIRKSDVPFDVIKSLGPRDKASSYKIETSKKGSDYDPVLHSKPFVSIISQCAIPAGAYDRRDSNMSMQEFEDQQTKELMEEHEREVATRLAEPLDLEVIERICPLLKSWVNEYVNLSSLFNSFSKVPGFIELLREVVKMSYEASSNFDQSAIQGKLFELKCAMYLINQEKEEISHFTLKGVRSTSNKCEYDLATFSGRLIECKLSEKNIDKGRFTEQAEVACNNNKKFAIYFEEKISEKTRKYLQDNYIEFKDNLKSLY